MEVVNLYQHLMQENLDAIFALSLVITTLEELLK